jgi:hypothetical protein
MKRERPRDVRVEYDHGLFMALDRFIYEAVGYDLFSRRKYPLCDSGCSLRGKKTRDLQFTFKEETSALVAYKLLRRLLSYMKRLKVRVSLGPMPKKAAHR